MSHIDLAASPSPSTALINPRYPDIAGPEAGVALVSRWDVGTPDLQRAAIAHAQEAWHRIAWPEGLLSVSWFAGLEGETVFVYSKWEDEACADRFAKTDGPTFLQGLKDVVPGLELRPPVRYQLYRSARRENAPPVGCLVVVSVTFDGADAGRQRRWIDLVFEALAGDPSPHPGGISGHFHVSLDGTRVLNYAEWTSADAHRDALERAKGSVGHGPKWREVQSFPGLTASDVRRYTLVASMESSDRG